MVINQPLYDQQTAEAAMKEILGKNFIAEQGATGAESL